MVLGYYLTQKTVKPYWKRRFPSGVTIIFRGDSLVLGSYIRFEHFSMGNLNLIVWNGEFSYGINAGKYMYINIYQYIECLKLKHESPSGYTPEN